MALGRRLFETVAMSCRVTYAKAKRVLGWKPRSASYCEGLPPTVEAISCAGRETTGLGWTLQTRTGQELEAASIRGYYLGNTAT